MAKQVKFSPIKPNQDKGQGEIPPLALGIAHVCKGFSPVITAIAVVIVLLGIAFCLILLNSYGVDSAPMVSMLKAISSLAGLYTPRSF
ncbi:hypothetical protein [Rossellomorea marisflavi]|uniref:hypothetical protein n=1 Tax=Rossellomorea marisflavi TaxID=189381 RepID=UPI00064FB33D|nr:hypothetical protein [Rossellomorea marisflavi]KML32364.1 hypothetical protein VL12_15295 [Rossellomorea marisflavi]